MMPPPQLYASTSSKKCNFRSIITINDWINKPAVWSLQDTNDKTHYLIKFDVMKDPSRHSRTKSESAKGV
jgi:hypothetical protein